MSVDEIEKAITKLLPEERTRLLEKLAELDAEEWDRQIDSDAENGKLDKLFESSMDDFRNGRFKEI